MIHHSHFLNTRLHLTDITIALTMKVMLSKNASATNNYISATNQQQSSKTTTFVRKVALAFLALSVTALVIVGCHKTEAQLQTWSPSLGTLNKAERMDPHIAGVSHDVREFYEALHNKSWQETYAYRNKAFRDLVPINTYLRNVQKPFWELVNYDVLNVQIDLPEPKVTLICKFVEYPPLFETYQSVTWQKENDGKWHCDSAGPIGLPLFVKMPL
jgi:hypothetical protein